MTRHQQMLPGCFEKFEAIHRDVSEIKSDVKHIRHVLSDDPNDSIAAAVNRHKAYWRLFAILAAVIALACTIAGTIYAAVH